MPFRQDRSIFHHCLSVHLAPVIASAQAENAGRSQAYLFDAVTPINRQLVDVDRNRFQMYAITRTVATNTPSRHRRVAFSAIRVVPLIMWILTANFIARQHRNHPPIRAITAMLATNTTSRPPKEDIYVTLVVFPIMWTRTAVFIANRPPKADHFFPG